MLAETRDTCKHWPDEPPVLNRDYILYLPFGTDCHSRLVLVCTNRKLGIIVAILNLVLITTVMFIKLHHCFLIIYVCLRQTATSEGL